MFSLLWKVLLSSYRGRIAWMIFLALLAAVMGAVTVGLGVPLIDTAMGNMAGQGVVVTAWLQSFLPPHKVLLALIVLVCLFAVLHSLLMFFAQYVSAASAQLISYNIKLELFERTMKGRMTYLMSKGRGTLLHDINASSESVYHVVDLFGRMAVSLFQAVWMVGLMVYFSWEATLVVAFLAVVWWWKLKCVLGVLSARLGKKIYGIQQEISKADVDAVDGIRIIKSHTLEPVVLERQRYLLQERYKPKLFLDLLTRGVVALNEGMGVVVVIVLAVASLGFGWISMSFATLIAFMVAIRRASPSLGTFSSMYLQFLKELKSMEVTHQILSETPQEKGGIAPVPRLDTLRFENVSFAYPGKREFVLQDIELVFRRGEIAALVGLSGAGKSTLIQLLLRFYDPVKGEIWVGTQSLSDLNLKKWRNKVGYVSQDIFLFNDTIRNNMTLWNSGYSQEEMVHAAKNAQIHDFVLTLPKGYDTIVGDRGLKLSGGQCQRVAIVRELLKKPEVLLFDEATSALDNLTERAVYDAMLALREKAIVIVAAHRLSTVREADQIVVIKSGRIEGFGRHDSLLKEGGFYSQLYGAAI